MPPLTAPGLDGWNRMAKVYKKIFEVNPSFTYRSSSLYEALEAVATGGPNLETSLQTALDKVKVEKAKKYRQAIKLLVDDYPNVCYTGIEDFKTKSNSKTQPPSNLADPNATNRTVRYTSAEFMAKAKVFCIVGQSAPVPFHLGFIQHCTAKSDVAQYSNSAKMRDHCTGMMPVGDSAGTTHAPFYFKGVSHGCTAPAYVALIAGEATHDLEIGDYFNNNCQFYHPRQNHTAPTTTATCTSTLRDQSFTLWIARRRNNTERLLRQVTYRIVVEVTVVGTTVKCSTSVKDINVTKPDPAAQRPNVTSPTMNNLSQWQYCAPASANWVNVV